MVNYPKKVAGPGGFLRCGGGGGGRHSSVFGLLIFLHLWIKIDAAARPGAPQMLITNDDTSATGMHISSLPLSSPPPCTFLRRVYSRVIEADDRDKTNNIYENTNRVIPRTCAERTPNHLLLLLLYLSTIGP